MVISSLPNPMNTVADRGHFFNSRFSFNYFPSHEFERENVSYANCSFNKICFSDLFKTKPALNTVFRNVDFSNCVFNDCDFHRTFFIECDFSNAVFASDILYACFDTCIFNNTTFKAFIAQTHFPNCLITHCNFHNINNRNRFTSCLMEYNDFSKSVIDFCNFYKSSLIANNFNKVLGFRMAESGRPEHSVDNGVNFDDVIFPCFV